MTGTDLPTGTVTFLFSDIEGSTRLVASLGPLVYRDVLELHNRRLREAFARHGGVERGTQGDAFLVIFGDPVAALAAAVDAQRSIADASWPTGAAVRVRMGLHTGQGIAGGDDYVGIDVNRAARIAAAASGGQVLVSEAVRVLAERELTDGVELRDLGDHRLRDLSRPERLYQVVAPSLPSEFPPIRAVGPVGDHLPARLTSFIGREREIADLTALLGSERLVTLTGPGGTGKTSLAVAVGQATAQRYADGAWFVALEGATDPTLVPAAIASAIGLVESPGSVSERLVEHLAGRSMLLVLDNLEQVRDVGGFIVDVLRRAEGVRILATSRAPLAVSAEQEYPVQPLPVRGPDADARSSDCVRLFVARAARIVPGYQPADADVAAIGRICERLDGLPLAVELAAGRIGLLPPTAIEARIRETLELPGSGPRDLPERQRTLQSTIAWSYELLGEPARTLLARLAVFSGGARLEEIVAVAGGAEAGSGDAALEALSELVEHSLVRTRPGSDGPRFELLETIRLFAAERLTETGAVERMRRRHADAYLALAESSTAFVPGRDQRIWLARLSADHANLRAATRWCIDAGDTESALRFVAALWRFWQLAGHLEEGVTVAEEVLGMSGAEAPTRARLKALEGLGGLHYWRAEQDQTESAYAEQLELAREIGDERDLADALFNLSFPTNIRGDPESAERLATEAGRIYAELGDLDAVARIDWTLASVAQLDGRMEPALPLFERALEQFEAFDDLPYVALTLGGIGWYHMAMGDYPAAVRFGVRSLLVYHTLGDVATTTITLDPASLLLLVLGRDEDAATAHGAYEALASRAGVRPPAALQAILYGDEIVARRARVREDPGYQEARARGAAMSLDEAVDFVARATDDWLTTAAPR